MKSPWMAWPDHSPTALPEYAKLSPSASKGRAVFSRSGCLTCHSIGGIGSQFGPNLTNLKARLSRSELIRYIQAPPDGVPMPAYEARLTEAELNQVVDFVLAIQTLPREL
jgi:putative heme-binding domain-containing protein